MGTQGLAVHPGQMLAFRLGSHNLATRLPAGSLLSAASACGVQNSPPGTAALALHARIAGLTPADVDCALERERTLLQAWSLRGAPYLFPARDAAVFTLGLLPEDEESLRAFILGAEQALDLLGMSATEAVERTAAALCEVLDGRVLANKQRLDAELAERVAVRLPPQQLAAWQSPSWYGPNQRLGEAVVSFSLRPVSLRGLVCFAPRRGNEASFVRTDQWLGAPLPAADPEQARAELVRRYLHCYGPSTVKHLAEWAGIGQAQATRAWALVEPELVEVSLDGHRAWLLERDVACLMSPPTPEGVRFLPPHDPYLALRDRATLIPDKALQRRLWRVMGNPGVVLVDGRPVALWRPRKAGRRLKLRIEAFAAISEGVRPAMEAEAASLAPFKGCTAVEMDLTVP